MMAKFSFLSERIHLKKNKKKLFVCSVATFLLATEYGHDWFPLSSTRDISCESTCHSFGTL